MPPPRRIGRAVRQLWRWLVLALPSLGVITALWWSPLSDLEAGPGLTALYAWRGTRAAPPELLIVSIDIASARTYGLPERLDRWPRARHAELIDALHQSGARVIGFDILFMEPRDAASDAQLAAAVRRCGRVVLVEAVTREPVQDAHGRTIASVDRRLQPLPALREAALATGPFILPKSPQGIVEFWPHLPTLGDLPALPTLMAQAMGHPAGLRIGTTPADRRVLNLYGPLGTLQTLPYTEAIRLARDPQLGPQTFDGKAVMVGFSEANQSRQADAYPTPYTRDDGVDISGVELGATALANLLDGSSLHRLSTGAEWALLLAWTALLTLPWMLLPLAWAAVATTALTLAHAWGVAQAFAIAHWWLPVILPLAAAPVVTSGLGVWQQARRSRRRQAALESAMEQGVSRVGLERMLATLGHYGAGQTVHAVCLYSDIEGYTALSESLPPAQMRERLNRYYQRFLPLIDAHGGHVADTVGDSIMAIWLADDHPQTACRRAADAALALHEHLNIHPTDGALPTRFGLHLGPVYLGPVGTDWHREIRAVGDLVNTCSRIQSLNKQLGTRILVSEAVAQALPQTNQRPLGPFVLAGKSHALALVELRAPQAAVPPLAAAAFRQGLAAFAQGRLRTAHSWFEHSAHQSPDGRDAVASFYMTLCERLEPQCRPPSSARTQLPLPPTDEPPRPNWNGQVRLDDK